MIKNAMIESTKISIERGMLTAWIYLDYGGSIQGFGGFALYLPESFIHHDEQAPFAGHWIYRVMEVVGVKQWSDLEGKAVRVISTDSEVKSIGHFIKDTWFCPRDDFKEMSESRHKKEQKE